ncbi:CHAT domain-containing protein [Actinomadura xylanilytica]|uniref:CHAT domain-containing protein n=1 Tax=Actinomadura xylanilytica TaxID=887459 RepID=UPI00255B2909|nr:CHAT domain-containing protein [Actinomadura xylanilytica]MDL4775365.1 CHAT domain-containing protein [Actinomadura xylanilytica]
MIERSDHDTGGPASAPRLLAAVAHARELFGRGDVADGDDAYRRAVALAEGDLRLRLELAADHLGHLMRLGALGPALERCDEYLARIGLGHLPLRVLRMEIRFAAGGHAGAAAEAAAIRTEFPPDGLGRDGNGRIHRVQGLAAADRGDLDLARGHLDKARALFSGARDPRGVAVIDRDLLLLDVLDGRDPGPGGALPAEPRAVQDHLLLVLALRRRLDYDDALLAVLRCTMRADLSPVLRWPVLRELTVLLGAVCRPEAAERLLPLLREAAAESSDPAGAAAELGALLSAGRTDGPVSARCVARIRHARRLIDATRLDEAERLLLGLRPQVRADREVSLWHLAAGELEFARSRFPLGRAPTVAGHLQEAAGHLHQAAVHAPASGPAEVRVRALRLLGHTYTRLGTPEADGRAVECWAEAHRLEERAAGLQPTGGLRAEVLQAVPDEHDERLRAAARTEETHGTKGVPAVVAAMEAARGTAVLGRIPLGGAGLVRDLPGPSDLGGAWRWARRLADSMPRDQLAWLVHSAPGHIHHAFLGRGLLQHTSVPCDRGELTRAIDLLGCCWSTPSALEECIGNGRFDERLEQVAEQIGLDVVIPRLPAGVRRIAVVAGGALSDVPFAAMTVSGRAEPLGLRFALSDLPCLSARLPLHLRSLQARGDSRLLVRPGGGGPGPATIAAGRDVLAGDGATPEALREALGLGRHRQVRIDGHDGPQEHGGHEDHDGLASADPVLELAPQGSEGHLRPDELQRMDLNGCGTLVLGACETGMARRIGRDERPGFVRAALSAGAASVIAARWAAPGAVTAPLLDRFERYARYLPRDVALQRAQRDVYERVLDVPDEPPALEHPARWACWTLYGDSGRQTDAGPVSRRLRARAMRGRDADRP